MDNEGLALGWGNLHRGICDTIFHKIGKIESVKNLKEKMFLVRLSDGFIESFLTVLKESRAIVAVFQ